jgi:hypothetical protein
MQVQYGRTHVEDNVLTQFADHDLWKTYGCSVDMCNSFVGGAAVLVTQTVTGGFNGVEVNSPSSNLSSIHEWSGSVTKAIGKHQILAGGGWDEVNYTAELRQGTVTFSGTSTANFNNNTQSPKLYCRVHDGVQYLVAKYAKSAARSCATLRKKRVTPHVLRHTTASYRDTFRLLLQFAQKELRKSPSKLAMTDLNAALIGGFLDNLEKARANASRSRNLRLTAIRSFFRYAALECPEHSAGIQRVLAIPPLLSPFTFAADVGAALQVDVALSECDEFRKPKPGLNREQQKGAISSTQPSRLIWRGQQSLNLGPGQEIH